MEKAPQPDKIPKPEDEPLKLDNLLIRNVNTWGNVEYNVPLRISYNESRTGTNVAHRYIPAVPHSFDVNIRDPFPERVTGRDMVVEKETYRTTTGGYTVQPNPNKAMERADSAANCKNVIFISNVDKKLQRKTIIQPKWVSEMKDNFRGLPRSPLAPPDIIVKAPDPEQICDIKATGRNETPCIPETMGGFRRLLDPYVSEYRAKHRIWTPEEQLSGPAAKDIITMYTENNTPKVKGFGPRIKEDWMPLQSKPFERVFDRALVKKEYHEVAAAHNAIKNILGIFESEMKRKYKVPYVVSPLASWDNGENYFLAPFPPNPYQTDIAPFMYCSDYCHIAQGTRPCSNVEQFKREFPAHQKCVERLVVSRDG